MAPCVIPAALVDDVVAVATEQERLEAWIMKRSSRAPPSRGLYPPHEVNKARYEAAIKAKQNR